MEAVLADFQEQLAATRTLVDGQLNFLHYSRYCVLRMEH
jgi:hypothetical protein